ncbi:MAG: alpha/beta hydrolase [Candidatus Omnitrophota bacterium]|nr:alpha/beta hydrolase [Candidatus Omnitrophota bacterium]
MVKRIMYGILAFGILVGFVVFYARWFERSSIFFPRRTVEYNPDDILLPFEDVHFRAADGVRLNGWFIPAKDPRGTLIICHGNAGNIGHRLDIIRIFNELGLNVFVFDYRGYGRSGGRPSEQGTYLDARAAYEYLLSREDVDKNRVIVYGKSLGGSVAVHLALKADIRAVISNSAFTSTADMAGELYPFLPVKHFVTMKYDTFSRIGDLDVPKLIIHSEEDEIVPFRHGERLFEQAAEPKEFYRMRGGHNDAIFIYEEEFKRRVHLFLENIGL